MKIESIEIQNFGVFYGKQPPFVIAGRGLTMVLGDNRDEPRADSNGAGKSTVFDALDWALFGQVPKEDHADSIINEESGKDCCVVANLVDDDGSLLKIQRSRKYGAPRGLQVWYDGREITTLDDKETQSILERILGMDREVFHAAVYYAQNDGFNFADAKDSERIAILTKVLSLEQIDTWLERVKERTKALQERGASYTNRKAELSGMLEGLKLQDFSSAIAAWEANRLQRLSATEAKAAEAVGYCHQALAGLAGEPEARAELARLESLLPAGVAMVSIDPRYEAAVTHHAVTWRTARAALDKAQATVLAITHKRLDIPCPSCGQTLTKEHWNAERARSAAEVETLTVEEAKAAAAYHAAKAEHDAAKSAALSQQQQAQMTREMAAQALGPQRAAVAQFDRLRAYYEQMELTAKRLGVECGQIAREVNPEHARAAVHAQQVLKVETELLEVTNAEATLRDQMKYLEFWVDGLGPKGLKSYILDTRLQEMTDAANEWVRILTGGTTWVRFETQTMGRSTKTLSNKINVRVFRYNRNGTVRERNYRSWSGGEKKRVSWGIAFGLSRLVAKRATKSYDTLILDEAFKHVDRAGRQAVMEMLRRIKQEKSSVFVIEHDADFQAAFERRIVVRKENERSQVIEESDVKGLEAGSETQSSATTVSHGVPADANLSGGGGPPRRKISRRPTSSPGG